MTIAVAEGLLNGGARDDFIDAMAAITGSIAEARLRRAGETQRQGVGVPGRTLAGGTASLGKGV